MLEIDDDQPFQERIWVIQRIGWCLLLLFLGAAVFGFTSSSIFTKVVEEKGGYRLEYPRFGRIGTGFELLVSGPAADIFFSREILRRNEVSNVVPAPESGQPQPNGVHFRFASGGRGEIQFELKPRRAGRVEGKIVIGNPPTEFDVSQLIYF